MRPGARLAAAIDVLREIEGRHRPAALVLSDWGRSHRFAGSGDRAAIGNVVYDVLRRKRSLAARMDCDDARALVLAVAPESFAISFDQLAAAADGSRHSLTPLTDDERAGLQRGVPEDAPVGVRADLPDWVVPPLMDALGSEAAVVALGAALAQRAPVDVRANTLKADRDKVLKALAHFNPQATPHSPVGVRIPHQPGARRPPNVEAETSHGRGWFEIQDEGSQVAALLACAGPREQMLDLCAGAGGKTLALGAGMRNTGQIYAYDRDGNQLRPIFERIRRAGLRNVQVMDAGREDELLALGPRFDLVFVDAPCTGTGVWRRRPDAKWRVKPTNLETRLEEQRAVLELAGRLVRPGGRLVYVTCSLLRAENGDQVSSFLASNPAYAIRPFAEAWAQALETAAPASADGARDNLLLTPDRHETDGFFVSILQHQSAA